MSFRDKLGRVVKRHEELSSLLATGGQKDAQEFARLSKEYSDLGPDRRGDHRSAEDGHGDRRPAPP